MTDLMPYKNKFIIVCFLIVEAIVIIVSLFLIRSLDTKEESGYDVIEQIPCDALLQQQEEIAFVSNGQTQVYQMPVSLMRGESFEVRFSVDCDDMDGGMIFVDLFGNPGYDSPNAEIRRTALEGQYVITDCINYSGVHPLQCDLRIFTLGDVSASISDVEITRVREVKNRKEIVIICILLINAVMTCFVPSFLTRLSDKQTTQLPDKQKKGISYLAFGLIVCMQTLLMIFWMQQKSNFYVDELYSMEKAQYFSSNTPYTRHMYEDEGWQDRTWMGAERWKETLELTGEESVFFQSPVETVESMITGRNYNGLLNVVESFVFPGVISQYPGTLLNLFFFVLTQIVLFGMLLRNGANPQMALFGVFWYGFCGMTVSMMEYTRFYGVTSFLLLLVVAFHLMMWNTDKPGKMLLYETGALLCAYLAFKNSELVALLFVFLSILFTIGLLIRKRFKAAICYVIPVHGLTAVFVILKTPLPDMITHYSEYLSRAQLFQGADDMDRIEEMLLHMQSISPESVLKQILSAVQVLIEGMFGSWIFFIGFAALLIVLLVSDRKRKEGVTLRNGFCGVIAGMSGLYFFFMAWAFEVVPRYYSFITALIVICLTVFLNTEIPQKKLGMWSVFCMSVIFFGVLTTHITGSVEYIYRDEREFYRQLEEYKDTDSIVDQTAESFQRSVYDCVRTSGENRQIYPVSKLEGQIDVNENQSDLLLWMFPGNDVSYYERELSKSGFKWQYLGKSEASEVYLFQRN